MPDDLKPLIITPPHDAEIVEHRRLVSESLRAVMAQTIGNWLDDPEITDLKCQPISKGTCQVLVIRNSKTWEIVGRIPAERLARLLRWMASLCGKKLDRTSPELNTTIPG